MKIKKVTKNKVQMVLPALFALILIGFFVNRNIQIRGLYGDDLYLWSFYGEDSFWKFTFPESTKGNFRPFYWAMSYLEFMLVGRHVNFYSAFNTAFNILISFVVYFFALDLTKVNERRNGNSFSAELISFLAAGMYLGSHFAAYQIGQVLGLLESLGLLLAIIVLWLLYRFSECGENRYYYGAAFAYFLVMFTHERYIALFPLFCLVLIFRGLQSRADGIKGRCLLKLMIPVSELLFFFGVRVMVAGQAMPAGTAGTDVTDTFSIGQAFMYALQQVQYVFGVNVGESYLNGITWGETPLWLHICVYLSWAVILAMLCIYASQIRKHPGDLREIFQNLLFIAFIALCIGCSSITIRLEIRWVYVSYTAALLYICFISGKLEKRPVGEMKKGTVRSTGTWNISALFALLFLLYCCLMIPVEQLYRSNFRNIFFMTELDRVNSLADETIGKYRDFLGVRQTYIFYNSFGMTEFYGEYFYKPYDPQKTGQGSRLHYINDISELPDSAVYENSVVLLETSDRRGYIDITDQVFGKADWSAVNEKER
ncbi:hypothetical protein [Oribacterium sp. P6A1]|uniref:hypothetical protein n=1 Tax=Oribacterium sp. P6A1 TaxID=1410612 RepID=UPI0012DC5B78|nr:hypothetical protein [Oribacterium sp. P6A1]